MFRFFRFSGSPEWLNKFWVSRFFRFFRFFCRFFCRYTVTTSVVPGSDNQIEIPVGGGVSQVVGGNSGTWYGRPPNLDPYYSGARVAAHEAGHLMGLPNMPDSNNIMGNAANPVTEALIEQILRKNECKDCE
jgi:hypothetical protein